MAFSKIAYDNFIDIMIKELKDKDEDDIKGWFKYDAYSNAYFANIVYLSMSRKYMAVIYAAVYFERWVENGLLANAVVTAC